MKRKIKCKVCGERWLPEADKMYIAEEKNNSQLIIKTTEIECFDCPQCGCQYMAKVRAHKTSSAESLPKAVASAFSTTLGSEKSSAEILTEEVKS